MRSPLKPDERLAYLPAWPGLADVFKVDLAFAPKDINVQLPAGLDDEIAASPTPHRVLVAALANAIRHRRADWGGAAQPLATRRDKVLTAQLSNFSPLLPPDGTADLLG